MNKLKKNIKKEPTMESCGVLESVENGEDNFSNARIDTWSYNNERLDQLIQ
jgi:hypothetical protein